MIKFLINVSQFVADLIPNNKRKSVVYTLFFALYEGIKDLFYLSASSYNGGLTYSMFDNTLTYAKGDVVMEIASGNMYQSIKNSNTDGLEVITSWRMIAKSYIGLSESVNYNASYITLTYALNKRYDKAFVDYPNIGTSEIYLDAIADGLDMFQVGAVEANSSYISAGNPNTSDGYICAATTASNPQAFSVFVPAGWWPTYFANFTDCENSIRTFLNPYIPIGIQYEVTDY